MGIPLRVENGLTFRDIVQAFHEIERWMTAPPIPIEPIGTLPPSVMRHMDQVHGHGANAVGVGQRHSPVGEERARGPDGQYERQYAADPSRQQTAPSSAPTGYQRQEQRHEYLQDAPQIPQRSATENPSSMDPRHGYEPLPTQGQPQRPSPVQTSGFIPVRQTPPVLPDTLTPLNAADSYLERVNHDARLQGMLAGTPSRSMPFTSANTVPGYSQHSEARPPQMRRHSSNPSHLDKPLPTPHQQHRRYVSHGDHSAFAGSQQGAGQGSVRSARHTNGLHSKSHSKANRGISQPDRYPPFQTQATSILDHAVPVLSPDEQPYAIPPGYIDPRHVPLPE